MRYPRTAALAATVAALSITGAGVASAAAPTCAAERSVNVATCTDADVLTGADVLNDADVLHDTDVVAPVLNGLDLLN